MNCDKGLHFPLHVYDMNRVWKKPYEHAYMATCAACGEEYKPQYHMIGIHIEKMTFMREPIRFARDHRGTPLFDEKI